MPLKHAVPMRMPGARIALTTKTLGCTHTGVKNNGANSTIRGNNSAGRGSIGKPPGREDVFLSVQLSAVAFSKSTNGQSRAEKGNHWVERVLSLRQTCRIRGRPTFPLLVEAVSCLCKGARPDLSWITEHECLPGLHPP